MKPKRKTITGPEKLAVLKRYLVDKAAISNLCDEYNLQPSQIYKWEAQLFEHGGSALERKPGRKASAETAKDRAISQLKQKLAQKNEVISELMEENVRAKKATGEL